MAMAMRELRSATAPELSLCPALITHRVSGSDLNQLRNSLTGECASTAPKRSGRRDAAAMAKSAPFDMPPTPRSERSLDAPACISAQGITVLVNHAKCASQMG